MDELLQDVNGIWVDKTIKTVSYPSEGHDDCFLLEESSFWFNHRNKILKSVMTRFPFIGNFADIGGANGYQAKCISENFPNAKIFLVEPGYDGCLNAKKRGLENVYNLTFQKFDFIKENVSAVGLFDVLEHIENDVDFLLQLKEKLPKNSLIYITLPSHMQLWSDVDDYGGHYKRYDLKMVKQLSQKINLEILYFSYFFTYMPFIIFFVRRLPYVIRGKRDNVAILDAEIGNHTPSKFFLSIFNFFHKMELKIIKKNRIKHGGSCILILKT